MIDNSKKQVRGFINKKAQSNKCWALDSEQSFRIVLIVVTALTPTNYNFVNYTFIKLEEQADKNFKRNRR